MDFERTITTAHYSLTRMRAHTLVPTAQSDEINIHTHTVWKLDQ